MADSPPRTSRRLRQATGAGMMDAKKALEETDGDIGRRQAVAAREGPGQGRPSAPTARTPRARSPLVIDGNVGAIVELKCETDFVAKSATQFKAVADDARRRSSPPRARTRSPSGQDAARRPQDHAQGEHRARAGRPLRGGRRQRARHLPAHPGRPRRQRRARRAGRRRRRSWPTTSPCTSPSPGRSTSPATRCPQDVVAEERATLEAITRNEGKPEQALPRSSRAASTASTRTSCLLEQPLRQGREAVDRRSCSASATIVALRPGRDRLSRVTSTGRHGGSGSCSSSRARRSPATTGYGIDGSDARRHGRARSSTSARPRTSTSPSSSAAATSGAA